MSTGNGSSFVQRLTIGTATLLFIVTAIFFSTEHYFRPLFSLLTAAFISAAVREYCQMGTNKEMLPLSGISIFGSFIYTMCIF